MQVTLELLEVLLEWGWEISYFNHRKPVYRHVTYRTPDGISGTDYHTDHLDVFPKGVEDWIRKNVPMTKEKP
jgi:hypothetical protein